ncbi:vWA domain-containing protein [Paenibacillus harenae]|uniref:vWA domain-containing protein n=1 Tax=Paenibacillus harenae TaxID=306543 RepID=UPI0027920743|nr:VWA domain-containing protein [Paenibacillus harenae]MDQ0059772.1 hypothetical protein [Paenibacillus harenae]
MQFLSLSSAWFAIAMPLIAAMYILKRTYMEQEIASHMLWRRALNEQEANRPWQKLRSRLLLLLQLAAALLLTLALMQPVIMRTAAASGHAVIVIDRSASMTARSSDDGSGRSTKLELAVSEAEQWLSRQPGNRPITLIATGQQPEVVLSRTIDRAALNEKLQQITPAYGKSDNTAALSLADSLLLNEPDGELVVFTDGLWPDLAEANAMQLHSTASLTIVGSSKRSNNQAILYFGIKADAGGNGSNTAVVTVKNDSSAARKVQLDLSARNEQGELSIAAQSSIDIAAGEWESVQLTGLPAASYYKAELRPAADAIHADNSAYQFPETPRAKQALLVTEGNLFLEKALQLAGIRTVKVSPDSAAPTGEMAEKTDWIVLDGNDQRLYNDLIWAKLLEEKPLWLIDHPQEDEARSEVPSNVQTIVQEHPVTSYITFSDTHISRLAKPPAEELGWGKPILTYSGIPAIYAGEEGGKPKLRFTFNLQDSDLPLRSEFPVLIVQAAEWMSGGSQLELGAAAADQLLELSLHSETSEAYWEAVEHIDNFSVQLQAGAAQTMALDLNANGVYAAPSAPGLYRLVEINGKGEVLGRRMLAVHADSAELARPADAFGALRLVQSSPAADSEAEIAREPNEQSLSLAVWAAALLLLLMAAEWEVYRRGHSS